MICETILLRKTGTVGAAPTLTTYLLDDPCEDGRKRPAIVICPGGGYTWLSPREAEPIAMRFLAAGFHAFILDYSVLPAKYPMALEEASMAVAMIRERAEDWSVQPDQIAICGFSAGGHLAAHLATRWNAEECAAFEGKNRPNAAILCYPPITATGEFAVKECFDNLLTDANDPDVLERVSVEKQVSAATPPTFLWHTVADNMVPVENSLMMADALQRAKIPFELHIYPEGEHALSLANSEVCDPVEHYYAHIASWVSLAIEWLDNLFGKAHN